MTKLTQRELIAYIIYTSGQINNYSEKTIDNYIRISRRNVQQIIKNEITIAFNEIKKNIHTHSLRHTGATLMYDINNTDIKVIQEILGHISISSTEIYTHVSDKRLKELMQNFNILDSEARNYEK